MQTVCLRVRRAAAAFVLVACAVPLTAAAGAWCDLTFKEVADSAPAIVLVRHDAAGPAESLPIVELIRGEVSAGSVTIEPGELRGYRPRDGQLFVVACDAAGRPIRALSQTGMCEPVSILPIHRGTLRSRFRPDYDGRSRALTLDALRAELVASSAPAYDAH